MSVEDLYDYFHNLEDNEVDNVLFEFVNYITKRDFHIDDIYTNITRYEDSCLLMFGYDVDNFTHINIFKKDDMIITKPFRNQPIVKSLTNFIIEKKRLNKINEFLNNEFN